MPLIRPTLKSIIERILGDVRTGLGINSILRRSFLGVFSRALAGQSHTLHGNLEFVSRQLFATTSDEEFLLKQAAVYGFELLPATKAELFIKITGAQGSIIPDQTEWQNESGLIYVQDGEETIPAPVAGVSEVTIIDTVADVSKSLAGKYFFINAPEGSFLVFYKVDGTGDDPNLTGFTSIQVDIGENDTANDVAAATQLIIDSSTEFSATVSTNEVTITNATEGEVEDATDFNSGFSVFTQIQGVTEVLVEAIAKVIAQDSGILGNVDPGNNLTILSPIPNVDSEAEVDSILIEGEDIEDIENFRTRFLERIQSPPSGGNVNDYIRQSKTVAGVTRVWVFPDFNGINTGSVGVTFVEDNEDPIIPDAAKVAEVDAALKSPDFKPVTAEVVTFAPGTKNLDAVIKIKPNTQAVRTAAIAQLKDLIFRDANPKGAFKSPEENHNGKILLTKINEAISTAVGEEDHEIVTINGIAPANVEPDNDGEIIQLGTITWQALI